MGHFKRETVIERDFVPIEVAADRRRSRLVEEMDFAGGRSRSVDTYSRRPRSEYMAAPVPYYAAAPEERGYGRRYPAEYPPDQAPRRRETVPRVDDDDYYYSAVPYRGGNDHRSRRGGPEADGYYRSDAPRRESERERSRHPPRNESRGGREGRRSSPSSSSSSARSASGQRMTQKQKDRMGMTAVAKPWNIRSDPNARAERKKFEKECPGFDWSEGVGLALTAIATVVGVDKIIEHAGK